MCECERVCMCVWVSSNEKRTRRKWSGQEDSAISRVPRSRLSQTFLFLGDLFIKKFVCTPFSSTYTNTGRNLSSVRIAILILVESIIMLLMCSTSIYMCLYVYVCVHVWTYCADVLLCVKVKGHYWAFSIPLQYLLRQGLPLNLELTVWLHRLANERQGSSCLPIGALYGYRNANSDPHACAACILPTEPSPQTLSSGLYMN